MCVRTVARMSVCTYAYTHMSLYISACVYVVHSDTPNGSTHGVGESGPACLYVHVCMFVCLYKCMYQNLYICFGVFLCMYM